jgi:hypothetical protein
VTNDNKLINPIVFGTLEHPWIINDCLELQDMNQHLDGNYILGNDIDCYNVTREGGALYNGGLGFSPIGSYSYPFMGNLNGNEKIIEGILINRSSSYGVGLFGYAKNSTIYDLNIVNLNYVGRVLGGLIGSVDGSVLSNINLSGDLENNSFMFVGGVIGISKNTQIFFLESTVNIESNNDFVGGIIGSSDNNSTLMDINSKGEMILTTSDYVGGIIGSSNNDTLNNCSFTGSITGANKYIGGLVGTGSFNINQSSSIGSNVYATGNYVGGLAGLGNGLITNSYSTRNVNALKNVGGLVGSFDSGEIRNSFATGNVIGRSTSTYAGGLIGSSNGTIINCYSLGNVTAINYSGGFIGSGGTIINSFSKGNVVASSDYFGGFIGDSGSITNSYSIGTVSGSTDPHGGFAAVQLPITNSYWFNSKVECYYGGNTGCPTEGPETSASVFYGVNRTHSVYNTPPIWDANWTFRDNNYPILSWQ